MAVSFFSAAEWFDPAVWEAFFSALTECLSLTPRKYCEIESKWFPCDSLPQMAADIACVNHRKWKRCEAFIWTVRLDGRAFANVNLWKRKSRMYSDCHLYLPAKWATRDGRPADLERFFVKGVGILSAFYGDMDLCSAIDGESSPGRGPWHLKYEFPTFRWRTFFGNAVVSFFGERKFDGLPCRTERLDSGMLLDFGANPEEADLNRNRKLEAERILGEYSFVIPAAFPRVDEASDRFRRSMVRLDPLWHLPRMPGGARKPEFTYVPTYASLANELSDPIDGFASREEFERMLAFLDRQIAEGAVREEEVGADYFTGGPPTERTKNSERWFVDVGNGHRWRLVEPDPPFYGAFLPVPEEGEEEPAVPPPAPASPAPLPDPEPPPPPAPAPVATRPRRPRQRLDLALPPEPPARRRFRRDPFRPSRRPLPFWLIWLLLILLSFVVHSILAVLRQSPA